MTTKNTPTSTPTPAAGSAASSIEALIKDKVSSTVKSHFGNLVERSAKVVKNVVAESLVLVPKAFGIKTEKLSGSTREAHERLYGGYIKEFNQVSTKLDAVAPDDVQGLRDLRIREQANLNAVKLHELYFSNIADPQSVLHVDSLPYMRLSRDWGTFDKWQVDFRATCLAAEEGWGVCVYDPFKQKYMNVVVDGHTTGLPLGAVPILVMDMWSHAYFRDYLDDKFSYVNNMLREVNWTVVEARMLISERSQLDVVYRCVPVVRDAPQSVLQAVSPLKSGPVTPQTSPGAEEMVSAASSPTFPINDPMKRIGQVV